MMPLWLLVALIFGGLLLIGAIVTTVIPIPLMKDTIRETKTNISIDRRCSPSFGYETVRSKKRPRKGSPHTTMLMIIPDKMLTSVAPYNSLNPNRATTFPCLSFKPFTAPTIVPMEPKFANEIKNTDTMATVLSLN